MIGPATLMHLMKINLNILPMIFRTISHTRLKAHDFNSSTLISGKGEAGPNSLHTTIEGPTKYVNARWMYNLYGFLHGIKWIMFHAHLEYFQKPPLEGSPNTKPGDPGTPNFHKH